ncbi:MAG: hypothetical protein CMO06_12855 [Thalassospira sp.]|uniref:hypothetical protein n=1 Tax=Thalassospira sp. TaxID=1912094 RepID=UPI000C525CB6|nr:hypothetical protein [Thalassospira sp.]MAZ34026.1 hypothetical protein [Thalassospira sp.]
MANYASIYYALKDVWGGAVIPQLDEAMQGFSTDLRVFEFVSIALLHRSDQSVELSDALQKRLEAMRPFWHLSHESMNFRLMRVIAEVRLAGRLLVASDLAAIKLIQRGDGGLVDGPEGISSQYHAYMLLLLLRWGDKQDEGIRRVIVKAFAWLYSIWRCYGDPSPLGRGRFQLFGYAALAAACHHAIAWGVTQPEGYAAHIHDRLTPEEPTGALSARWSGPFRDALLHGYNTLDDYRAFADFWTADIPSVSAICPVSTAPIFHILDFSGSCLIADTKGPLYAITPTPLSQPEDKGRKHELREALRMIFRKRRYVENIPPKLCSDGCYVHNGASFWCKTDNLVMEAPASPFWQSPIIWTRADMPMPEINGTMECTQWYWSRPNTMNWSGHSFRVFGGGRVHWNCS